MSDRKYDFDVTRATAIINVAMQNSMFPLGVMPESDTDKIIEAEKLVELATQAFEVANVIGRHNVAHPEATESVLFEAQVLVGANGNGTEEPSTPSPSSPAPLAPASDSPASVTTPPADQPATTAGPSSASSSAPSDSSPSQPSPSPDAPGVLAEPQKDEDWEDAGGGGWRVLVNRGHQLEVSSLVTGEQTLIPTGFLKRRLSQAIATFIDVEAKPMSNELIYTHPGCTSYMVPLDDCHLPAVGSLEKCANCGTQFPVRNVVANGYVAPVYQSASPPGTPPDQQIAGTGDSFLPQQEQLSPSPSPESSSPSSPEPASSSPAPSPEATAPTDSSQPSPPAPESPSESSAPSSSEGTITVSGPSGEETLPYDAPASDVVAAGERVASAPPEAREDDDDPEYAKVIGRVEANFTPEYMPAPQDMEREPLHMPDDITQDDVLNRGLHMQFNALAARARYLFGIENAIARDCGRLRKRYMKPAMRNARLALGKEATVTEVSNEAESYPDVVKWTARQERHADRADAYKTFFEIYAENVKTLSRDLTFAGAEERGS